MIKKFILLLLLLGIVTGVYLVQSQQFFKSFAGNSPIVVKSVELQPNAPLKVVVELNSPLGPAEAKGDVAAPSLSLAGIRSAYGFKKGNSNYSVQYDLNTDGVVNIIDFALLLADFRNKLAASTKPQNVTVSYRLTEDALNINQLPFISYTDDPMVVNYEFKDKRPGKKFIWVDFQDSTGKIERRSVPAETSGSTKQI